MKTLSVQTTIALSDKKHLPVQILPTFQADLISDVFDM